MEAPALWHPHAHAGRAPRGAGRVGDEFLVMLPEALGFLSALLEDPDGGVERAARALLKDVEEMSEEKAWCG